MLMMIINIIAEELGRRHEGGVLVNYPASEKTYNEWVTWPIFLSRLLIKVFVL